MGEPPRGLSHILNPSGPSASGEIRHRAINGTHFLAHQENGRLYHAWRRGTYPYPTDDRERNRYDMIHHLVHCILLTHTVDGQPNSQVLAKPMVGKSTPYSILDLGCGSGIWALDMGTRFPDAEIVGVDIVGGQAAGGGNVTWRTPDANSSTAFDFEAHTWPFAANSFDLIHAAHLCGSVSSWPRLLDQVKRHLRPKTGQVELFEIDLTPRCDDGTLPPDSDIHKWWDIMQHATRNKPIACPDAARLLYEAGFVDIEERTYPLQFTGKGQEGMQRVTGEWNRNLLQETGTNFEPVSMISGLSLGPMTRNLGWSKDQVDHLVDNVLRCIADPKLRAYHVIHIWTARRPGSDENL